MSVWFQSCGLLFAGSTILDKFSLDTYWSLWKNLLGGTKHYGFTEELWVYLPRLNTLTMFCTVPIFAQQASLEQLIWWHIGRTHLLTLVKKCVCVRSNFFSSKSQLGSLWRAILFTSLIRVSERPLQLGTFVVDQLENVRIVPTNHLVCSMSWYYTLPDLPLLPDLMNKATCSSNPLGFLPWWADTIHTRYSEAPNVTCASPLSWVADQLA